MSRSKSNHDENSKKEENENSFVLMEANARRRRNQRSSRKIAPLTQIVTNMATKLQCVDVENTAIK